ncbi:MAG: ABC transporter permease subunit [Deltaproteobacteria bacterium]|nr:ABC transporter permease subunit [Deltaproteobacteria bacterium]
MRNVLTIAGKELRIYLTTWTSYILFGAFMLITAYFFQVFVIRFQLDAQEMMQRQAGMLEHLNLTDRVLLPVFANISVFFLFLLPVLTMRLVAEERRGKTLELLMTLPARPLEIVLAKYLAAVAIMGMMLALTVVFPVLLHAFGTGEASPVDWSTVLTSYVGLALMGAACVAVGLFTSAVTESQIIAAVVGFGTLLILYVIGGDPEGQGGVWQSVLDYLSITSHLEKFVRGIVRISDVAYYLSLAFVGLFLTHRVVEAQRWR